jgi:hypothetical protein
MDRSPPEVLEAMPEAFDMHLQAQQQYTDISLIHCNQQI